MPSLLETGPAWGMAKPETKPFVLNFENNRILTLSVEVAADMIGRDGARRHPLMLLLFGFDSAGRRQLLLKWGQRDGRPRRRRLVTRRRGGGIDAQTRQV